MGVSVSHQERLRSAEGGQNADVGGVPAGEYDRARLAGELSQFCLDLGVAGGGAGDDPRRSRAGAELLDSLDSSRGQARIPSQIQIIVGGEVEQAVVDLRIAGEVGRALRPAPG